MAKNPFDEQKPIPNVNYIIAVSSGKGGVGKSTVTTNLALALAKSGAKVGLLDADIYGPSIPRMVGATTQIPEVRPDNKILPIRRYNMSIMSLGFLVQDDQAIIWRGPMLFKAIEQLLRDVDWGTLDYLLVDLPPGTGDVQLTLCQKVPLSGAISVCTPQNIALIDVKRSIDMFKRLNVPLLGLIENMSYFLPHEFKDTDGVPTSYQLFPKGELDQFLKNNDIKKIGEIPFTPETSLGSEIGVPIIESAPQSRVSKSFFEIAGYILSKLA